jgi:hypothetical protein
VLGARVGVRSGVDEDGRAVAGGDHDRDRGPQNAAQAERFSAYAVVAEHDDPHAKAIQKLVEHSRELEQIIANLKDRLVRLERIEATENDKNIRVVK